MARADRCDYCAMPEDQRAACFEIAGELGKPGACHWAELARARTRLVDSIKKVFKRHA